MTYTPDEVARDIITEGQNARTDGTPETLHDVITPRGIQIALATAIVESGDRVLANPNVPESENFPNDGDGFDHSSAGPFQQQHNFGWGTVAEEMDPRLSAAMFYNHLANLDYNDPNTSPGTFAQDVQGSAFPDRYDQHFDEAVAQYNRLIGSVNSPAPVVAPTPVAPAPSAQTYNVEWGDTLSGIASQFGVSESALLAANPSITDPNFIEAGQVLAIPYALRAPQQAQQEMGVAQ
jgi:LysM repeat protein